MELLAYIQANPVIPFIGIAFAISIILIFITKQTEDPPDIVIPPNLNVHTLVAFLIKISLERPKGLSILTLVVLFLVIATGTALSTYADYIKNTQDVSGDLISKVDELAKNQKEITVLVNNLSNNIENRATHPRLLSKLINENMDLINLLEETRLELNASRVSILEFHNGSQTFSGMPFGKVSATQEVTGYGVSKEINNLQSIPIREFISVLPSMVNNELLIYAKHDEAHRVSYVIDDLMTLRKTEKAVFVPLFVPNKTEPIGMILIEWNIDIDTNTDLQSKIKHVTAQKIKLKLVNLVQDINKSQEGAENTIIVKK